MKKQSGFTLIELMVVMAIIAILATAGLSAYTGYIKKARDAKRIADLNAINTIIQSSPDGPPADMTALTELVKSMNNGVIIQDPLYNADVGNACYNIVDDTWWSVNWDWYIQPQLCYYWYEANTWSWGYCTVPWEYILAAYFESESNRWLMKKATNPSSDTEYYWLGTCTEMTW